MRTKYLQRLRPYLNEPINAVDVGARWGVLERFQALGDQIREFGFEPDVAECKRLNKSAGPHAIYEPIALGSEPGEHELFLTIEPACASFYPPVEHLTTVLPKLDCIAPTGVIVIPVDTLDNWRVERGVTQVDALKLDTQGSELLILQGAVETLKNVKLVEIEVSFNTIYKGQALFPAVDTFMREHGFVLWRFTNETHYSIDGVPGESISIVDTQRFDSLSVEVSGGGGQLYWCNAYYTREEFTAASQASLDWEKAVRGACVAVGYGLYDLALVMLKKAAINDEHREVIAGLHNVVPSATSKLKKRILVSMRRMTHRILN